MDKHEAAWFLGVSPNTVSKLFSSGAIPSWSAGHRNGRRAHRKEVVAHFEKTKKATAVIPIAS